MQVNFNAFTTFTILPNHIIGSVTFTAGKRKTTGKYVIL